MKAELILELKVQQSFLVTEFEFLVTDSEFCFWTLIFQYIWYYTDTTLEATADCGKTEASSWKIQGNLFKTKGFNNFS